MRLEPMLHLNEKPTHHNEEEPLLTATRESLWAAKDPARPKITKSINLKKKKKRSTRKVPDFMKFIAQEETKIT